MKVLFLLRNHFMKKMEKRFNINDFFLKERNISTVLLKLNAKTRPLYLRLLLLLLLNNIYTKVVN